MIPTWRSPDTVLPKKTVLPEAIRSEGVCTGSYPISPRYEDFARLSRITTRVSSANHDLAALLYIAENGYAAHIAEDGIHRFEHREYLMVTALKPGLRPRTYGQPPPTHDFGYEPCSNRLAETPPQAYPDGITTSKRGSFTATKRKPADSKPIFRRCPLNRTTASRKSREYAQ